MKIGLVGLGRMGGAMSQRLREQGFEVVGWDANADRNKALGNSGLRIAANPRASAAESQKSPAIWLGTEVTWDRSETRRLQAEAIEAE